MRSRRPLDIRLAASVRAAILRAVTDERTLENADGWNRRYAEGTARWDLGEAPPVLGRVLDGLGRPAERHRRVLVPGAGYGHDAMAWARAGYEVTAVDFAPLAVEGMRDRARAQGVTLEVLQADVLDLPRELNAKFDFIWEQTCLCALYPEMRDAYVASMARSVAPEGRYIGLFWNHGNPGGPPYDMPPDLVERLFGPAFQIDQIEPVPASVSVRDPEFLARMRPRRR